MYGGLVMPSRSMQLPSVGNTAVMSLSSRVMSVPRSMPYAPVSSDESQISLTPSAIALCTRCTSAAGE